MLRSILFSSPHNIRRFPTHISCWCRCNEQTVGTKLPMFAYIKTIIILAKLWKNNNIARSHAWPWPLGLPPFVLKKNHKAFYKGSRKFLIRFNSTTRCDNWKAVRATKKKANQPAISMKSEKFYNEILLTSFFVRFFFFSSLLYGTTFEMKWKIINLPLPVVTLQ